jgi:uncharacterized damage-inducible protein DinB
MPGLVPPVSNEREALLAFLNQQRQGIRNATHGLTDEQATSRPSVSELSVAGLVKHVALVERQWMVNFVEERDASCFGVSDDYERGFELNKGETLDSALELYAGVAKETERIVGALDDLGAPMPPTPAGTPWIPEGLVWSPRWVLLHLIEETARHAGHADIVRESIDGATCWALMAAAEGWESLPWE